MKYVFEMSPDDQTIVVNTEKPAFRQLATIECVDRVATVAPNTYELKIHEGVTHDVAIRKVIRILSSKLSDD
jgi:hypothetical protein